MKLSRIAAASVAILATGAAVTIAPTAAHASPLDNCWVTAYRPWISGNTITFSASSFCSPGTAVHQFAVERYRNGSLQGYTSIRCVDTSYCHGETTQQDSGGSQQWCTVIEGTVYIQGYGGRSLSEKTCETDSW